MTGLAAQTRAVDALSTPYARALTRWATTFVRAEVVRAVAHPRRYAAGTKQERRPKPGTLADLRRLLLMFGLQRGQDVAAGLGARSLRGSLVDDALAGKPIKIDVIGQWVKAAAARALAIAEDTQERVREHVRRILGEGDRQSPRATVGEITRRIATEIKAGSPDEPEDTGGVFSWARAQTIARTELVQVENTARVVAYAETGVTEIEWLAYRDGRSGERHHERMQGVRVRVGETFTTPLGHSLRYPGDPLGPIGDTANCRCTVRPVRRARSGA